MECTHLGFVPLLCLLHVLAGNRFILGANVLEGSGEVWLGDVHLNMDLLQLVLLLQLPDFLKNEEAGTGRTCSRILNHGLENPTRPVAVLLLTPGPPLASVT